MGLLRKHLLGGRDGADVVYLSSVGFPRQCFANNLRQVADTDLRISFPQQPPLLHEVPEQVVVMVSASGA